MAPGERPAVTDARRAVEAVWRSESARIVGALARYTRDFALAEDVAQEALAEALVSWATDGIPDNPPAWLLTVGRRRAIDAFRRRAGADERYAVLARELDESTPGADALFDPDAISDDVLALIFTACHPVLSQEARIALTLRVVGGLTADEIAKSFLVPTATIQARITRAKKTLGAANIPFELPPRDEQATRLGSVLSVLYLIFTEGSSASRGDSWIRLDLASEATRLARVLVQLLPGNETFGLLALMELTAARFSARLGPNGKPVLLEDQDRARWDRSAIVRGRAALAEAREVGKGLGPYGLQASIAECHIVAASVAETDWDRIVALYDGLQQVAPSPIVDLNRAVAVAYASGPAVALGLVDDLAARDDLRGSQLLPAVRAELLSRLGRTSEAREEYLRAAALADNAAERSVLAGKAAALA